MRLASCKCSSGGDARPAAFLFGGSSVYLLYLDDAGSVRNVDEEYLVLGGVCVHEPQVHWFTRQLDKLAEEINPANPQEVEFHASEIFSRRAKVWRNRTRDDARGLIKAVLRVLVESYETARAFACAVHKSSYPDKDPVVLAFEDLCSRFDLFLDRLQALGDRQRGILILDKSTYETTLQKLAQDFRVGGTRWGKIHHLVETPLFVDSRASRLIQLADHIAYAVFRRYNAGDAQYFDVFASRFDQEEGIIHGLSHKQTNNPHCMCPACFSRRTQSSKPTIS